jgi:hypothetical protein
MVRSGGIARESGGVAFAVFGVGGWDLCVRV